MIQHVLIAISGVLISYPLVKNGRIIRSRNSTKLAVFGIIGIATFDFMASSIFLGLGSGVALRSHDRALVFSDRRCADWDLRPVVTSQFPDDRACPSYFGQMRLMEQRFSLSPLRFILCMRRHSSISLQSQCLVWHQHTLPDSNISILNGKIDDMTP